MVEKSEMSEKSKKKAPKASKVPACFATVSLTVRNVENTKFLVDDFEELGIEAKFAEKSLKCKNLTEKVAKVESSVSLAENLSEESQLFQKRSRSSSKISKISQSNSRISENESRASAKESKASIQVQPPKVIPDEHFAPSESGVVFNYEIRVDINNEAEILALLQNPVQCELTFIYKVF